MRYFKDTAGAVWGFDETEQAPGIELAIAKKWTDITNNWPPKNSLSVEHGVLRESAILALQQSDITVLRCYEDGIPVPAEWRSYRSALRAIMDDPASHNALPATPALSN